MRTSLNFNILFICITISVLWLLTNIEQWSIVSTSTFVSNINTNQSANANTDIYEYIVTAYKSTLNSMVNANNSIQPRHSPNISNIVENECKPQYYRKTVKCKFNNTCTKSFAEKLFQYPHFSQDQLIKNNNFKLHSETIQNLKYLIVSHHGGTHIATLSYLKNILQIPSTNIAHICSGSYCSNLPKFHHYYNYFNKTFTARFNDLKAPLNKCCWRLSQGYWKDIKRLESIQLRMHKLPKIDVIICTFPSTQCAWLLPFAKVIIIRFMHRFNHHVWMSAILKWGRLIHSMSHYCHNIILTASNAYDWYYAKHFLNLQTDSFLLWPNFARHFVDDFMSNIPTENNTTIASTGYNNVSSFILSSMSVCPELLDVSRLKYTLENEYNINILDKERIYKPYIYNKKSLHHNIGGIIAVPHSVHGAKWVEYYSVGFQLFFPTLKFWIEMNNKCRVIAHRQAGNKPHIGQRKPQPTKPFNNYVEYSPCCGTSPLLPEDQKIWLQFSDYYMNENLLKYVIYFNSLNDLIDKIVKYNDLSLLEKLERKRIQMNEFTQLSERFAPHLVNGIYNSYQQSETKCNVKLNELTKCLVRNPYKLRYK